VESASVSIPPQLREEDGAFFWKTDLEETQKFWKGISPMLFGEKCRGITMDNNRRCPGWFQNMSSLFLSVPAVKMLMVAGVDRLDGPLTMAQMQGKFQLSVLPGVGHSVQEDVQRLSFSLKSSLWITAPSPPSCRRPTTALSRFWSS